MHAQIKSKSFAGLKARSTHSNRDPRPGHDPVVLLDPVTRGPGSNSGIYTIRREISDADVKYWLMLFKFKHATA